MFHMIRPGTNINFVGHRHVWIGISVLCILGTIALFFTKGLNYGIDFTAGAEVHVKVPASWEIGKLRTELEASELKGQKVIQIGEPSSHEFMVRAQGDATSLNKVGAQVEAVLAKSFKKGEYEILGEDVVGPAAGSSLKTNGLLAMFYAMLAILVYVAIRFDMRYAPGAVAALFHDSIIVVGVFILTGRQFDLTILAAILALIGYSNNDTIIVFDRVRETVLLHPEMSIEDAVNRSVNETLGRTILTSLMTFITVAALWMWGGSVIENFAFTLMIGIVVGTYSSIFIASSLVIYLTHYQQEKLLKQKAGGSVAKKSWQQSKSTPAVPRV